MILYRITASAEDAIRRETGDQDLFRSRLDQIIDMDHPLAKLARTVDWPFLEGRFGEVYTDDPGHPPLPTRLMTGLAILEHTTCPMRCCASEARRKLRELSRKLTGLSTA